MKGFRHVLTLACVQLASAACPSPGVVAGTNFSEPQWRETIDTARRQGTLSQKMTNEFLLIALGIDPEANKQKMEATLNLYGATLQAFMRGTSSAQNATADLPEDVVNYLQEQVLPVYTSMASLLQESAGAPDASALNAACRSIDMTQGLHGLFMIV